MRIALVCEHLASRLGGAAHWSNQIAHRLAGRGHDVVILTFASPGGAGDDRDQDLDVRRLSWHPSRRARAHAMAAAVDAARADVVHDTGVGWSFDVFHPQTGARLANYRRDMASRTPRERLAERLRPRHWRWLRELRAVERRQFARPGALFVAVSSMVASSMEELYGVPPGRIRHVPNGVDVASTPRSHGAERTELRRSLGVADDETLFLFAAHNPRLKGVRPLLEATHELRSRQARVKLAVIGRAPDADLRHRVARLDLADSVLLRGFVDDATAYHAAADAVVQPSYHDACSLTVFEACAFGAPVITSRYNGASEHVTSGREGFVVDEPEDVPELARCMLALTDPRLRRRMATAAAMLARRHDLGRNVEALEAVLYEAEEERRRRGTATRREPHAEACTA